MRQYAEIMFVVLSVEDRQRATTMAPSKGTVKKIDPKG